jgi:hypothetical protein
MLQCVLITVFIISAMVAEAQTCSSANPATALGTYCKSDFDGGNVIPPAIRRTPPPSPLDDPDPRITPGVTNPRVTQANIAQNICSKDFRTAAFRPKPAYTNALKRQQLREYGDTVKDPDATCVERSNNPRCYEEDHLIAIEDGGNPFDPRNLWPEPTNKTPGVNGAGWESKDLVESFLHDAICFDVPNHKTTSQKNYPSRSIPLQRAQEILAQDWYACYEQMMKGKDCQ